MSFFLSVHCIKQIDSMLPCVCSGKDHRRRQNVVRTSVTPLFCSYHILSVVWKTLSRVETPARCFSVGEGKGNMCTLSHVFSVSRSRERSSVDRTDDMKTKVWTLNMIVIHFRGEKAFFFKFTMAEDGA